MPTKFIVVFCLWQTSFEAWICQNFCDIRENWSLPLHTGRQACRSQIKAEGFNILTGKECVIFELFQIQSYSLILLIKLSNANSNWQWQFLQSLNGSCILKCTLHTSVTCKHCFYINYYVIWTINFLPANDGVHEWFFPCNFLILVS